MNSSQFRSYLLPGLLGLLGLSGLQALPTVDDGLHLLRQGRLREAEPILARGLTGPELDRVRAGEGLVALAMHSPFPERVRSRWARGEIGGVPVPSEARRLMELELAFLLEDRSAPERFRAWHPEPWSPQLPKLLDLARSYLPPEPATALFEGWLDELGGPHRAGERLTFALAELCEEQGLFAKAARLYRDLLREQDVLALLDEWTPRPELAGLEELLARIRRTHRSPAAVRVLTRELIPDQNLGWVQTIRGWSRLAWVQQHLGDTAGAESSLRLAEEALPTEEILTRLDLAALSRLLGRPQRSLRLYQTVLALPPSPGRVFLQSLSRRGQILALLGSSQLLAGKHAEGAGNLREAARLGADLSFLPAQIQGGAIPPEVLVELADLAPGRGLGLLVARSFQALGNSERARAEALGAILEGPRELATEALTWLLRGRSEGLALASVRRRDDWTEMVPDLLAILATLPPSSTLAPPLQDFLLQLPEESLKEYATPVGRILQAWSEHFSTSLSSQLQGRLPHLHQEILELAAQGQEPRTGPSSLTAEATNEDAVEWWTELVMSRGWRKLARSSLGALDEDKLGRRSRRTVLLARARLESLDGEPIGALLRGLRALEAAPSDLETRGFLTALLEDDSDQRRILGAWAAHVDNDSRFALPLADLWASTARPQRGLAPLLAARAAAPRSPEVASRLGRLLQESGKADRALPHLLAAARLWGFAYSSDYAGPLAQALVDQGRVEHTLRLFHFWLRGPQAGTEIAQLLVEVATRGKFLPQAEELLSQWRKGAPEVVQKA